jgi:hypothetical protein
MRIQRPAIRGRELLDIISARQIVVRSAPPPSSLRRRRTAARLWGLTAQRGQTRRHSCRYWVSAPSTKPFCEGAKGASVHWALMPT